MAATLLTRLPVLFLSACMEQQALAEAAGAVHEARLEEQQLQEGRGLVMLGALQACAPAEPKPLTRDQLILLRKGLESCSQALHGSAL